MHQVELLKRMNETYQHKSQSVYEHGVSVHKHYNNIVNALDNNDSSYYQLLDELIKNWNSIKLLLYSNELMKIYHVYHDCGKPFCREVDEDGKQHFEGHSKISSEVFSKVFSDIPDTQLIQKLIESDMVYHSCCMEDIELFIKNNSKEFCFSLWMTSLAEIYANKEMFDENNQVSFKIKYKKLVRVLKKLLIKLSE